MPSIFYQDRFEFDLPVTMLLLERLDVLFKEAREAGNLTDERVPEIVRAAIQECTSVKSATDAHVTYVLKRLTKMVEEAPSDDKPRSKSTKTLASAYIDWIEKLEADQLCLVAANFDYFEAKRLYCEADRDAVIMITRNLMRKMWEDIKVRYESVMYGFGGSYKEDKQTKGDVTEFDLEKDPEAGLAAMRKLL